MLHAILNNRDMLGVLENDCTLGKFYQETKDLSAEERGKALDNSADIGSVHNGLVAEGQSQQVEGKHTRVSTVYDPTYFQETRCAITLSVSLLWTATLSSLMGLTTLARWL